MGFNPAQSRQPWGFHKLPNTSPAEEGYRPMAEGGCPLAA